MRLVVCCVRYAVRDMLCVVCGVRCYVYAMRCVVWCVCVVLCVVYDVLYMLCDA